jgi:hypothetical protein
MSLMVSFPCGTCGKPIFAGVASCPHCGATNRVDFKVMTQRLLTVLGALLGLGLLTLLWAPQTKNLACTPAQNGSNGPQGVSSGDVDGSMALIERFSIDSSAKQIVFPGSKEIKEERVPYVMNGNLMTFEDRFGDRFELNLKTATLRSFAKAGPEGRYRLSATAMCTGL